MYMCRECENEINQATELCPHCGADLTALVPGAEALSAAKPSLGKILCAGACCWECCLGDLVFLVVHRSRAAGRSHGPGGSARRRIFAGDPRRADRFCSGAGRRLPAAIRGRGRTRAPGRRAQLAQSVNYQIQYTPGPRRRRTERSARLRFRRSCRKIRCLRNFYLDDTGILRATRERAAPFQKIPLLRFERLFCHGPSVPCFFGTERADCGQAEPLPRSLFLTQGRFGVTITPPTLTLAHYQLRDISISRS